MVLFDRLKVSDDGKRLYVTAHVNKAEAFKDVYLDSITIFTAESMSSKQYPDSISETTEGFIYREILEGDMKEYSWSLEATDFNEYFPSTNGLGNTLFFVFIKCKATDTVTDECIPCRLKEEYTLGVTFDEKLLYQRLMNYTRELAGSCQIPKGFTDFILLWNAFNASVETDHYVPAIKYYNMLFGSGSNAMGSTSKNNCRCNG